MFNARRWAGLIAAVVAAVGGGNLFAQKRTADEATLRRLAAVVRPTPDELRWQAIPWEIDPTAAFQAARDEGRPIFLWVAGGRKRDGLPLERC